MANNANSHKVTRSGLVVEEIRISDFQKAGTATAVIKQTIETISKYPSKSVTSNKQDNVFSIEDFGFEEQEFSSTSNLVSFMPVPAGSTIESVQAQLAKYPGACNYRVLSNEPILTTNQKYSIDAKLKTMDDYANSQVVKYGKGSEKEGQLLLDQNGKVQYRSVFFSSTPKEDEDLRTEDSTMYLSKEIELVYNESLLLNVANTF